MKITIKKIYWERANLHITFDEKVEDAFIFCNNIKYELDIKDKEVIINFYNLPSYETLESGIWNITINDELLEVKKDMYQELDSYTRVFKYKGKYAYTVNLSVDSTSVLNITTEFYIKNEEPKKEKLRKKKKIEVAICKLFYKLFYIINRKKNVLIFSENDDNVSVNLEPLKKNLQKLQNYKINTLTKNCFKNKVSVFYRLKEIYYIAISHYIFIDNYTPIFTYLNIDKKVKLIQIWHAGVGFKSVGYARFGKEGSPHPYISAHRKNTHVIVDDEALIDIYREVFGLPASRFYPYGLPRLDNFLNKEVMDKKIASLKELIPETTNKKVILFAPTYRGNGQKEATYDMDKIDQDRLANFCKSTNSVVLFKFHPFTNNELLIEDKNKDYLIDINYYQNINDLLYITDVLITDYSSCVYEASLLDIPLVFYRFDKEEYEYLRGIHSLDFFQSAKYEALDFTSLLEHLEDALKHQRKKIKNKERNACQKIIKEVFGENI